MNRLNTASRARIIRCLCEGNSIRATARLNDCAVNTVVKLLLEVGPACAQYQAENLRSLNSLVVQVDEIWSFVGCKNKRAKTARLQTDHLGDIWTWTALDADSKLIITWYVGDRAEDSARAFMCDLADRLNNRIQLSSDGHNSYKYAVKLAFGKDVDYGQLVKVYGEEPHAEKRYSPAVCLSAKTVPVFGDPIESQISTSYIERFNLTMRMGMRRYTRLTNGHSKKLANHVAALGLYFMFYNFCRVNSAVKTSPAVAAGVTDHVWTIEEMIQAVISK